MFCTNCGNNLDAGDNFCGQCGKAIGSRQPAKSSVRHSGIDPAVAELPPKAVYASPEIPVTETATVPKPQKPPPVKKHYTEKHRAELKKLLEKNSGKEVTEEEVNKTEAWMREYASVVLEIAEKQWQWDQKLKQNPKGFHLEGEGYTCAICGSGVSNQESWYDKYGIKCLICQKAIETKIIPGSAAKNHDTWYSKYDLESRFNIDRHGLKQLMKQGVLKPRIIQSAADRPLVYLFLIKDHKDILPPKKLTESHLVKETKDGKDWYHSEPWYKFADPRDVLKDYKILDYLRIIIDGKEI